MEDLMKKVYDKIVEFSNYHNKTQEDKYNKSALSTKNIIFDKDLGKGCNIGSAHKYITRYIAKEGNKINNPEDLIKAIHFLFFEVVRNEEYKDDNFKTTPDHGPIVD